MFKSNPLGQIVFSQREKWKNRPTGSRQVLSNLEKSQDSNLKFSYLAKKVE